MGNEMASCYNRPHIVHLISLGGVSVFYCNVTNYHKLSGLKQHPFVISQLRWVRSPGVRWLGPLIGVSPGCSWGASHAVVLIWSSGSSSKFTVGRTQFHGLVGLRALLCWLEAWGHSQLLEDICHSLAHGPLGNTVVYFFKANLTTSPSILLR